MDRFMAAICWRSARFSRTRSDAFSCPKSILNSNLRNFFKMDEDFSGFCEKVNNFSVNAFLRATIKNFAWQGKTI